MTSTRVVLSLSPLFFILLDASSAPKAVSGLTYVFYKDGSFDNITFDTSFFMSSVDEKENPKVKEGVNEQINYTPTTDHDAAQTAEENVEARTPLNNRPIIGILSQELSRSMQRVFGDQNFTSYIAASYVKFVESAGARVVPIMIDQADTYYENLTRSLNGFLFPGGSAPLVTSGYSRAAKMIYDLVVTYRTEEGGAPVPLWGTCLGFENLLYFATGENPLTRCNALNTADPLRFLPGYEHSQMFGNVSQDILHSLATQNITANFHTWCVLPQTVEELGLNSTFVVLSTSEDRLGTEYVSTIEHQHLPVFGTQWHPEKTAYEWADDPKHDAIPHTIEAIRASQALAETFVQRARLNRNQFATREEETRSLIYNFNPSFVAMEYNSSFQLCYFFH